MNNAKKYRETTEWERLAISLRKLEILREHLMQGWQDKGWKQYEHVLGVEFLVPKLPLGLTL